MNRAPPAFVLFAAMWVAPLNAQATPDIELLINRGNLTEARTALASFKTKTRADSARALYYRGRIALASGATAEGVQALEASVKLVQKDGAAQYWLAQGYIRTALGKSRMQQAFHARRVRTALERATMYSPFLVDARLYLIQYYLRAPFVLGGSTAKARAQADTIFQIERLSGYMARAQVAEATNDPAGAERQFKAALEEFPDRERGYYALGGYYRRVQKYAAALDVFQRLQRLVPESALPHYQIGRTIAEWGHQLDLGEKELETALAKGLVNLDAGSVYYYLGMISQKRGDAVLAKQRFERALALDPTLEQAVAAMRSLQSK